LNRHKLLNVLRQLFSLVVIILIVSETIWGNLETHLRVTGLALLSLSFMMLVWGLNRYFDRERGSLPLIGVGTFIFVVSVVNELLLFLHIRGQ